MKRFNVWILFIIFILPVIGYAKSSVWIAEKDGNKIILAGSVHLLHPSQLPLPKEYLKALDESKRVVFEVDLAEVNDFVNATRMMVMFQLKDTTLDKELKPKVWQALRKEMLKYNVPMALTRYDAAFMSFSLPIIIWQQQGYQEGIDKILYDKAIEQKKEVVGLETFDEQLSALASMKQINPNYLIGETLKSLKDPKMALNILIADLYKGDIVAIDAQMEPYRTKNMEIFYQSLLVNRNNAWLKKIEGFAQDKKPTMVVVGAMHLAGKDSVLVLLQQKGYQIKYYE